MLYVYAFYSIKLPDWIGYTPEQVKFIIENALHRFKFFIIICYVDQLFYSFIYLFDTHYYCNLL
jgi:hypothetical protein